MVGKQQWRHLILQLLLWLLLFGLLGGWTACSQQESSVGGFSIKDRQTLGQLLPVENTLPLDQRVAEIPDPIFRAWKQADEAINPQAKRYKPYQLTADEQHQFARAIATLPASWQKIMQQKLTRFFFIDHLLGGGITDWIIDAENNRVYTMILNPTLLHVSAKRWLEMRENGSFKLGPYHIEVAGLEDISALEYILWHESAHLIDFETQQTPVNDVLLRQHFGFDKTATPFTRNVWKSEKPEPVDLFDFSARERINPYHMDLNQPQMQNGALKPAFDAWSHTPFVTIYASTSWAEDYADFAAFILALNRTGHTPYWLLKRDGETIAEFSPLAHTANKQRFIQHEESSPQ